MSHHRTRDMGKGVGFYDVKEGRRKRLMDEHKRHKRKGETKAGCPWCTAKSAS